MRMEKNRGPMEKFEIMASPLEEEIELDDLAQEVSSEEESEEGEEMRSYFPETWLWELHLTGDAGRAVVQKELPHTLTEWVGSAVCLNEESGLGVTLSPTTIKAFQPFFTSLTLPYAAIRGEVVPIKATVFNYLTECIVVSVGMDESAAFTVLGSGPVKLCICSQEARTHTFRISPLQLGDLNITVRAESINETGVCGNGIIAARIQHRSDALTRTMLVEAEGVEKEETQSVLLCQPDGGAAAVHMSMVLPNNIVPNSARGFVSVIGDVMGPSLSGLENLLRMPTGGGEQNMMGFTPNIYVLQYLSAIQQLTYEAESQAKRFMTIGYQRELTYRHDDGSYSAFGKSDETGSMWLTAFVIKSFAQAKPYIFIDDTDLQRSIEWFRMRQMNNGCFPQYGRVIHKEMMGGMHGGQTFGLTAFVLAALLEAGVVKQDPVIQDALLCLNEYGGKDAYTLALMAYALTLYDAESTQRQLVMRKLNGLAIREDGIIHWEQGAEVSRNGEAPLQFTSIDIEMNAYILMSMVIGLESSRIAEALPVVRWLTSQRNSLGGFSSTQDTIVALQSLSAYAAKVYSEGLNMTVEVSGPEFNKIYMIEDSNRLLLHKDSLKLPSALTITSGGFGCALVQSVMKYNMQSLSVSPSAFQITTRVRNGANCMKRILNICTWYTDSDATSNMAVLTVKMVSGWLPRKQSLIELKTDEQLMLKRYEVEKNHVNLYFDEIMSTRKCFDLQVEQDMEVGNSKPATVQIYDYYDTKKSAQEEYSIKQTCGTKEELPFITGEEFEALEANDSFVGQVRVPVALPPWLKHQPEANSSCPTCHAQTPTNLKEIFCQSSQVFKVVAKRSKLRLIRDINSPSRSRSKQKLITYALPQNCDCSFLNPQGSRTRKGVKLLLMTNKKPRSRLQFESSDNVLLTSKQIEKRLGRIVKRNLC